MGPFLPSQILPEPMPANVAPRHNQDVAIHNLCGLAAIHKQEMAQPELEPHL